MKDTCDIKNKTQEVRKIQENQRRKKKEVKIAEMGSTLFEKKLLIFIKKNELKRYFKNVITLIQFLKLSRSNLLFKLCNASNSVNDVR